MEEHTERVCVFVLVRGKVCVMVFARFLTPQISFDLKVRKVDAAYFLSNPCKLLVQLTTEYNYFEVCILSRQR